MNEESASLAPRSSTSGNLPGSDHGAKDESTVRCFTRPELVLFIAVVLGYLFLGLVGHDPWKQDETYITEIVHYIIGSGDWTIPTMAGEPFMEKPPLYYWLAAICASVFSPFLPMHDAARLATGMFVGATCAAVAWTGRRWWGAPHGLTAILVLLSSLGMIVNTHGMLTDLALLLGFAIALGGLACWQEKGIQGAILFGTGTGVGFMGKGLIAPGVLGACILLLPILYPNWRRPGYCRLLALSLLAAAPWLFFWPLKVYIRSPQAFHAWFWLNNIGRFVGFSVSTLGAEHSRWFWLTTLPWFTFPAFPLAMATVWRHRKEVRTAPSLQIPIVLVAVLLLVLWQSASARGNYALPVLLPLALLAAPSATRLPAAIDLRWARFSMFAFGCFFLASLVGWSWMVARDLPPHFPLVATYLPQFRSKFAASALLATVVTLIACAMFSTKLAKYFGRGLSSWFAGLVVCWCVIASLWLPWLDAAKSYRSVFNEVAGGLPAGHRCVQEYGMGESERAMLAYFLHIIPQRIAGAQYISCDVLLVYGRAGPPPFALDPLNWNLTWEGARPGDRTERFWLYAKREGGRATQETTPDSDARGQE